jgi:hypothetical protein
MLVPTSWLFVRNDESVLILRPNDTDLLIRGPGSARFRRQFHGERALEAYQADIAAALQAAGWVPLGEGYDRRQARVDRRKTPRGDRRLGP